MRRTGNGVCTGFGLKNHTWLCRWLSVSLGARGQEANRGSLCQAGPAPGHSQSCASTLRASRGRTDRPHALCPLRGHCCPGCHSDVPHTPRPQNPHVHGGPLTVQPGTGPSMFRDRVFTPWSGTRWAHQRQEKAPGWGRGVPVPLYEHPTTPLPRASFPPMWAAGFSDSEPPCLPSTPLALLTGPRQDEGVAWPPCSLTHPEETVGFVVNSHVRQRPA